MRAGCERLDEHLALFSGRGLGIVTNPSGRDRAGRRTIDLLARHGTPVALFGPEHGLDGAARAGERVEASVDAATGVRVHSLYGETTRPTPAMLEGVEVLVYDIQDAGARCFTYLSTLLELLRAGATHRIPVVVLDRPAPTGGVDLDGPVLKAGFTSFVGPAPVPLRYGMTPGEFSSFCNATLAIGADLRVVELEGWERAMWYDATTLPWIAPSPALRTLAACAVYPGTVLFEATNVSEGRGTDTPFEWIGAPWLDADRLARVDAPGARLRAETRRAARSDEACPGVRIELADRALLRPVALAVRLLAAIQELHGDALRLDAMRFDRLAGTDALRLAIERGVGADAIVEAWRPALAAFADERRPFLRYR